MLIDRRILKAMERPVFETDEQRWHAVMHRNPLAIGHFFYAVKTTGVFCRIGCASRLPLRENTEFFITADAAQNANYRPCKRCLSPVKNVDLIIKTCRFIEESAQSPSIEELAKTAMMSTSHFQRTFKSITGLTPQAYASAIQIERVQQNLQSKSSISKAINDAGFTSVSRFYESSIKTLGMQPSQHRSKGKGTSIKFAIGKSDLGFVMVAATNKGICCILLGDNSNELIEDLYRRFECADICQADADFTDWVNSVISFVEAPRLGFDLPLDIQGTAFQQRVWKALQQIPIGSTASYTEIAVAVGAPKAVRAIAQACAANPLAVVVPCHRVVRGNGDLSGYRWGVERKRELLNREKR